MQLWTRALIRAGLAAGALTGPPIRGDGQTMDNFMAALLRRARRVRLPSEGLDTLRAEYAALASLAGLAPDRSITTDDTEIAARPARRYTPPGPRTGTMLYLHGGGFVMGGLFSHDPLCRTLSHATGLTLLALDYRLAPEHPFPAALNDATRAFRYIRAHEPGPIVVGGDSAGALLAAAIAQTERATPPDLQFLLYPALDMTGGHASESLFGAGYLLTIAAMTELAECYAPNTEDRGDARLSPLRGNLAGLAPAIIIAAGFDPLRDHAIAYAHALRGNGVPATLHVETALLHGFADLAGIVPEARRAIRRAALLLRDALPPPGTKQSGIPKAA